MTRLIIGCLALALITLTSCSEPSKLSVQNKVTAVELTSVKWGDFYITGQLLPGQTSRVAEFDSHADKLPRKERVSFIMRAGERSIYLETEEEFLMGVEDELLIVIDDNTRVRTPNP